MFNLDACKSHHQHMTMKPCSGIESGRGHEPMFHYSDVKRSSITWSRSWWCLWSFHVLVHHGNQERKDQVAVLLQSHCKATRNYSFPDINDRDEPTDEEGKGKRRAGRAKDNKKATPKRAAISIQRRKRSGNRQEEPTEDHPTE